MTGYPDSSIGIGIIGLGSRGLRAMATAICRVGRETGLHIAAVAEVNPQRLADGLRRVQQLSTDHGLTTPINAYQDETDLIADPAVDLVMITSPQYAHERAFALAAASGKLIYCDKPLAHSSESADRMYDIWSEHEPRCIIGFTRRYERPWIRAHELIQEGAIGDPHMLLLRSVIPYYRYFGGWWREQRFSGNLLNEKCAHHFDVFNWFTGSRPVSIHATGGRRVFLPRPGYPERCADCSRECAYRRPPANLIDQQQIHQMFQVAYEDDVEQVLTRDLCVYSDKADVLDHAVVSLRFANGMSGALFFSVFGPDTQDQETLEVVGSSGRLILNRHEGSIDVVSNHGAEHTVHDCRGPFFRESHFGADRALAHAIAAFAHDQQDPPAGFTDAYWASQIAFRAQEVLDGERVATLPLAGDAGSNPARI